MSQSNSPIKKTLITLVVLIIVGYGFFNSRFILKGPSITLAQIDETTNTIISPEKTLFLEGVAEHASYISINGRAIQIDETGKFGEKLLLSSGVSIIDIYAKDKFGKEVRKKVDVLYHGETTSVNYDEVVLRATSGQTDSVQINIDTEIEVESNTQIDSEATVVPLPPPATSGVSDTAIMSSVTQSTPPSVQ